MACRERSLRSLLEELRLGKKPIELAATYFLPKLTKKQMELVERKDPSYFKTFVKSNPDVDEEEIRLSESKSKFVRGFAGRLTFTLSKPSHMFYDDIENVYLSMTLNAG